MISGTTVSWYFTNERPKSFFESDPGAHGGHDGFFHSIKILVRYHLGTVAFGSLIIALIRAVRLVLEYIDRKFKHEIERSYVAKFIMCCCKCCLWCLEKIMKYINKNAYVPSRVNAIAENLSHHVLRVGTSSLRCMGTRSARRRLSHSPICFTMPAWFL